MYKCVILTILLHVYFNSIEIVNTQATLFENRLRPIPTFSLSHHAGAKKKGPLWLIISGRKVVPGSILKVVVQTLKTGHPDQDIHGTMRALLANNNTLVTSAQIQCQPGSMSDILLKVPENIVRGNWTLKLLGKDHHGLTSFKETLQLMFTPKFLTILLLTSRPIYRAGQTVHFRVIMLTREFQPYEKPVHVFILDPRGRIMQRWPSRQPSIGVISLQFDLPEFPVLGNWIIKVQANSQEQKQDFIVEQYFMPRFEVYVNMPHVFTFSDDFISGTVVANMTNGRHVYGNLTLLLQVSDNSTISENARFEDVHEQFVPNFTGVYDFFYSMQRLSTKTTNVLSKNIIKVTATVGDGFGWRINEGWAQAKLLQPQAKVTFLGESSLFFAPGMPLTLHIMVSYDDSHPLEDEDLLLSELIVTFSSSKNTIEAFNGSYLVENNGIAEVTAWIPEDAKTLEIAAVFSNIEGLLSSSSIQAIAQYSPKDRYLHLETSTSEPQLGEFIVFHVRNNFFVTLINYVVISGGILISSGQVRAVDMSYPSVTTFSLVASADMTPAANVVVWVIDNDGDVVASSLSIPINPLRRHEVGVGWNEHKDHSGRSVEVRITGEIGAYFATYSVWEETFHMNSGHDLSEERILSQMMAFNEPNYKHINGSVPHLRRASIRWRDRNEGFLKFFPTPIEGPDVYATFALADSVITTDARIHLFPGRTIDVTDDRDISPCTDFELKCLSGGCFSAEKRCDGEFDCYDSSDEMACPFDINPDKEFKLNRISRHSILYDDYGFNWAWQEIRGESDQIMVYDLPKRPQTWVFNGFAVGKYFGLGLFQEHIQFESTRPFLLMVEAPKVVRMWEQVALTVGVFNFHKSGVGVFINIPQSEDYNVIAVETNGIVESYNPRKLNGAFQHIMWLVPESSVDVHIPIVFNRMGEVEVTVEGTTQMQRDTSTIVIQVDPEGASIEQHTSILLDLKNRAVVYEFMDIHIDQSPIIPYSIRRRFVYGTPSGQVSITGDVVGPLFPETPINSDNMLGMDVIGAETSAYNFAANLWSLHYLRLTNQLTESKKMKVLAEINVDYVSLSSYQNANGGFSNWINCKESVWLTAHSIRSLAVANFQDWENYIFVDKNIIKEAVKFLLRHQTGLGSFKEIYYTKLNPKIDPVFSEPINGTCQNVSLTATALLALQDSMPFLGGKLHRRAIVARQHAMKYLETRLPFISDPYNIAIVAWALTKCDSPEKELAFSYLDKHKRTKGNLIYWSRDSVIVDPLVFEDSQRSYIQPREDNEWDSMTIETTAYALLVYVKREGIGILQENAVRFLGSMRGGDGGFMSTVDSLVALEALVKYSYRARLRNVTRMTVEIELSADPTNLINVGLTNSPDFAEMRVFELQNIWGHVNIIGRGSGQALIQLLYSYGVDVVGELDEAVVPSFELDVKAKYYGRNSSHILITSCQRWINTGESESSGLAVVEIHLPSGYYVVLSELLAIVESGSVKNLKWARRTDADVKFFFDRLTSEEVCFTYQVDRWYPVSNHSRYNLAQVYALYQPERFQMSLFEVFPLYALDICEVCGSFQCPYCPFYNAAQRLTMTSTLLFTYLSSIVVSCIYMYKSV